MPFQPVLEPQPLLLVPPLLPPLVLRTENGFFGAPRGDIASFGDCPPCARFQEPPFPPPDEEEPDDQEPPARFGDRNSVAVDPTRLLYRFEADTLPLLQAGAAAVTSIGVQTVAKVPLFRAGTDASEVPFSIPLHEPVSEHERAMAAVFTKALELGRQVAVEYRESRFFGDHRVPVSVLLV
jgi:hypothetical protein